MARTRHLTAYACGRCQERYLGGQSCPDRHVFGRSLGSRLACPACGDVIVLNELLAELGLPELW
jgi:ribosomal protein S27AE